MKCKHCDKDMWTIKGGPYYWCHHCGTLCELVDDSDETNLWHIPAREEEILIPVYQYIISCIIMFVCGWFVFHK